ncbi:hypothetical protein [Sphingobium yanoikuyae]|uniref:hypothetical protein n=1 Tax=Sphingobium yanoikuyae TaxID=13690 RepID=UPI0028A75A56|nr:hypothetical protein [Sphingobium yanoikuyae]
MKGTEMSDTTSTLSGQLMQQAVCNTDHPAEAATALLTAAAKILVLQFGTDGAIVLIEDIMADAKATWRKRHAN